MTGARATRIRRGGSGVAFFALACGAAVLPAGVAAAKPAVGSAMRKGIEVTGAFLPLPPSNADASAYFVVRNTTGRADTMTSATTTIASETMAMAESATTMSFLGPVKIPAHGRVAFKPAHDHLMLQGLRRTLKVGEHVVVRLKFKHAGTISVEVPVVPLDRILGPVAGTSKKDKVGK